MIDKLMLELIHREIDGENSPRESAAVKQRLALDPEAMRLYRELRGLSESCTGMPMLDPPRGLAAAIMGDVRLKPRGRVAPEPWQWRRPAVWVLVKYGYALAAGLLLGLFLASPLLNRIRGLGTAESGELLGSMVRGGLPLDPQWEETRNFGEPDDRGTIRLFRSGGLALVELELPPGPPAQARLEYEPGSVELRGFEQPGETAFGGQLDAGRVVWNCRGGVRYRFLFSCREAREAAIRVVVARSDTRLYSGTIPMRPAE